MIYNVLFVIIIVTRIYFVWYDILTVVLRWRSSKDPLSLQPAKVQVDHQVLKWNLWRHLARRIHKKTLPTFEGWLHWETGQPGLMPQPHSNQTIRNFKGEETLDIGSVAKVWSRPRIDKTWRCLRQCRYHFAVCILESLFRAVFQQVRNLRVFVPQ